MTDSNDGISTAADREMEQRIREIVREELKEILEPVVVHMPERELGSKLLIALVLSRLDKLRQED